MSEYARFIKDSGWFGVGCARLEMSEYARFINGFVQFARIRKCQNMQGL